MLNRTGVSCGFVAVVLIGWSASPLAAYSATAKQAEQPPAEQETAVADAIGFESDGHAFNVHLEQDGEVIDPDEDGVYRLHAAAFTFVNDMPDAVNGHLTASITHDHEQMRHLIEQRDAGVPYVVLTGTTNAWDHRAMPMVDEFEYVAGDLDGLMQLFQVDDANHETIQHVDKEIAGLTSEMPIIFVGQRYNINFDIETRGDTDRQLVQGIDEVGDWPVERVSVLILFQKHEPRRDGRHALANSAMINAIEIEFEQ